MLGRATYEDKEEIATNLPPLRSPRRKNKTWKVQWVCVSKWKLMAQNLQISTAEFHVRVFSPTLSGHNRWLPGHLNWFLGKEWRIPYVWKNAAKKVNTSYQKVNTSSNWVRPLKLCLYNITKENHSGFSGRRVHPEIEILPLYPAWPKRYCCLVLNSTSVISYISVPYGIVWGKCFHWTSPWGFEGSLW